MRSTRMSLAALSMLMTVAIAAHPARDQAGDLYARYVAALNAHDVNRAMSFYSRDTVVLQQGSITPVDLKIERGYREFEAATEAHFDTRIASATDDRVEVFETEANQFQRAIGAGPVTSHWIYRFHHGRILELVHLNAPDPIYLERYRAFRDWILRQPADAAQLIVNGDLAFNGSSAAMMLDRGRQWSEAHPARAAAVETTGAPDLILVNGKVFTANPQAPWAEAIAIRGDRIAAVGAGAAIRERAAANTRVVDVGGRVVIPGINDAHTHVGARPPGAVLKLTGNDPTLTEVIAAIRETAASAPPGLWLYGTVGENFLSDPNGTRFTLDQAAPGRLVKLSAWTGHGVTFSTPGLRAIGINDRDPDPPFGSYRRTPDGVIDGRLDEYADLRAHRRLAALAGHAAAVASLRNVAAEAIGYGITTIQAMGNALPAADLATMLPEVASAIRWRIIRFPILLTERDAPEDFGTLPRNPAPLITVSGVKWILDGTPVERLAAMNQPYRRSRGLDRNTEPVAGATRRCASPRARRRRSAHVPHRRRPRDQSAALVDGAAGAGGTLAAPARPDRARRVPDARSVRAGEAPRHRQRAEPGAPDDPRDHDGAIRRTARRDGRAVEIDRRRRHPARPRRRRSAESVPEHDVRHRAPQQSVRGVDARAGGDGVYDRFGLR